VIEKVEAPLQAVRGDQAQFTLTATFRAGAFTEPAGQAAPPKPSP
jgi:hypothetical protein